MSEKKSPETTFTTLPGGKEIILLVEDDSAVRIVMQMSLSRLGYQVLDASDGINALAVWKAHGDEIQLVLTDMVMPGVINEIKAGSEPQAGTAPLAPSQAPLILPLLHRVPIHI